MTMGGEGRAFITGGTRGIGRAVAVRLAQSGHQVVVSGRTDTARRVAADSTLATLGVGGVDWPLGSGDDLRAGADQAMEAATQFLGGPATVLVHSAGQILRGGPVIAQDPSEWLTTFEVNVHAFAALVAAAFRHGVPDAAVGIGSVLADGAGNEVAAYSSSKAALSRLARAMAVELGPMGTRINVVASGYVETDMTEALRAQPLRRQSITDRIPLGRWAAAEEIAGVVEFLLSPAASYVTGAIVHVDGGWNAA